MRQRSVGFVRAAVAAVLLVAAVPWAAVSAPAAPVGPGVIVAGPARVIDGDTLEVAGVVVRLEGIDAPELAQDCSSAGRKWKVGETARRRLVQLTANATVTCGAAGRDRYGRALARCHAAGRDVAEALVREGLAWAFVRYSKTFVAEEAEARRAGLGVWQAACQPAWVFRRERWSAEASGAPAGCAIKGNISRHGRIYHRPWDAFYGRTRIDPGRGERWFCDEAEARRAGWRPAAG